MKVNWVLLIVFVILANLIGSIGSLWTDSDSDWYKGLNKSKLNPPGWAFGVAWTLIFTLIGISFYFIYSAPFSKLKVAALILFGVQFLFNILWSYLFFGLQSPLYGFIGIILVEMFVLATAILFYLVRPVSGYLFIPYILWVIFAGILNWNILRLN